MKQYLSEGLDYSLIDLDHSINSGQVFLWNKCRDNWYGVNGQDILRVNKGNFVTSHTGRDVDFFRKKDKMKKILTGLEKDQVLNNAIRRYLGLRIFRQDPFQCLVSFIVSSNSNIQKIKKCLEKLCMNFGTKIEFDGKKFYTFPTPEKLANLKEEDVRRCGIGYRSRFVMEAARKVSCNEIDFNYLKNCSYNEAKQIIKKIPGVGDKVADCTLLFSLEKLEAFPLDRWIIRTLQKYYPENFKIKTRTITEKQYDVLHDEIVEHFGRFAGYAQQFLFKWERDSYHKKW